MLRMAEKKVRKSLVPDDVESQYQTKTAFSQSPVIRRKNKTFTSLCHCTLGFYYILQNAIITDAKFVDLRK